MKHFVTFFLKPLSFLPALVMMYAIYSFSAQTGTESGNLSHMISVKIVETASDTPAKRSGRLGSRGTGRPHRVLCTKSRPYDRILSACHRRLFSIICLRTAGISAVVIRRIDLRGLRLRR